MSKGIRTGIEFSEHELIVKENSWHLKKPNLNEGNIKFTTLDDVTVITGDYGNWILDLPIRLVANGSLNTGYLAGKCRQSSTQNPFVFDSQETKIEIEDYINDEDSNLTLEEKEYLDTCLEFLEMGEFDYHAYAFRNNVGRFESYESVPDCKKLAEWFSIICDAGDEICRRLKEQQDSIENAIDKWILEAGGGSMRDALNVALTHRNRLILALQLALDSNENAPSLKKSISRLLKEIQ